MRSLVVSNVAVSYGFGCFLISQLPRSHWKCVKGKGKGSVEYWVCQIQPGRVLYEIEGVPEEIAREAFTLAAAKLPFKTTFVSRTVM